MAKGRNPPSGKGDKTKSFISGYLLFFFNKYIIYSGATLRLAFIKVTKLLKLTIIIFVILKTIL
jgi:hypothetical protein